MSILYAATSIIDFIEGNLTSGLLVETNAARIAPHVSEGIIFDFGNNYSKSTFGNQSNFWLSFYLFNPISSWAGARSIIFYKDDLPVFGINSLGNATLQFEYVNGSNSYVAVANTAYIPFTLHRFDIHFNLAASGGNISVYQNNALLGEITGDTRLRSTAETEINMINWRLGGGVNINHRISAIMVSTEDTRLMEFEQLVPNGAGTNSGWTGSATDVDEVGLPNDADFIETATLDSIQTFALSNHDPVFATGYTVEGVFVKARARGNNFLRPCIYEGSTLGEAPSTALSVLMRTIGAGFSVNPNTGLPWTHTEINNMEAGVKLTAT